VCACVRVIGGRDMYISSASIELLSVVLGLCWILTWYVFTILIIIFIIIIIIMIIIFFFFFFFFPSSFGFFFLSWYFMDIIIIIIILFYSSSSELSPDCLSLFSPIWCKMMTFDLFQGVSTGSVGQ
jgi:hypothetical protein